MCALNLHPVGIPGFIVQGNLAWRGICHVRTWLNSINDPRDSCYLLLATIRFRPQKTAQNNGRNLRRNGGNQKNKGGNFRKFPAGIFLLCIKGQEDCENSHWSPDACFPSIEVGCPSKTLKNSISSSLCDQPGLLTTTLKNKNYFYSLVMTFLAWKLRFPTENQPMPKISHSWVF